MCICFKFCTRTIFSNAVFHWIQDHPRLLRRIYQALRPG
ncbi:methyltransferase domain-containing protein, partial [Limosilactobacillus fermentum]